MKYNEATERLRPLWDAIADAKTALEAAENAYVRAAKVAGVDICHSCNKPMPDYDSSMNCDGCHLPWGWDTPKGRRDRRAAELDAELARLRAEREKIAPEG